MKDFEKARLLGRIDVILETYYKQKDEMIIEDDYLKSKTSKKDKLLEEIESALSYKYDIKRIAIVYGKIEQIILMSENKYRSKEVLMQLKEIFDEIQQKHIIEFKKKKLEELQLKFMSVKALSENNIYTVEDLSNKTFSELVSLKGISDSSIQRLVNLIERNGIYLKE